MKILIVEDDKETAGFLIKGLSELGHVVDHADDGKDGLLLALDHGYDVLIVDRMLPSMDGLSLIKSLRAAGQNVPVLTLSALGAVDDKVAGLEAGADDYLSKPYSMLEVQARIQALDRRAQAPPAGSSEPTTLEYADLKMDLLTRKVVRQQKSIDLQPREFRLLEVLLRNAGRVMTRTMLLEKVWNYHFDPQTNIIDVHISRLRQKIDKGFSPALIQTIRNAGYSIRIEEAE